MLEMQKSRIDAMTRQELQNILFDSDLYDPDIIDYVKCRLRELSAQSFSGNKSDDKEVGKPIYYAYLDNNKVKNRTAAPERQ